MSLQINWTKPERLVTDAVQADRSTASRTADWPYVREAIDKETPMKWQKFATISGLALVLVFFTSLQASPVKATPPEDLNIVTTVVFDVRQGSPSVSGNWTATGFIISSGDLQVNFFNAGWNDAGLWLRTSHTTEVFTDSQGSITLEAQLTNISGRNPISGTGYWVIKEGTGAYANLHGQGSVSIYGELSFPYLTIVSEYAGTGHND